ncbi:MAG: hypothetical protein ACRD96_22410, partial [Bryobacteraceae bacterium]
VELYKAITARVHAEAGEAGGIRQTKAWRSMAVTPRRASWRGAVTLVFDSAGVEPDAAPADAPGIYASLVKKLGRRVEYAELTFFGDMRYSPRGRMVRKSLERGADTLFRSRWKMPVDVYEGPAMNHSYHEMIIGHGRCFSTILISEEQETLAAAGYTADYHQAQFLATKQALAERGRAVVTLSLKDLSERTLGALDEFFRQAASHA